MPRQSFESFSGLHTRVAEVCRPATLAALRQVLAEARAAGRRVSAVGAQLSFDTQALPTDLAVSLEAFTEVHVDRARREVTAGAGARWADVVARTAAVGLVPPVVATASDTTVGGTLASNAVSRFSPVVGKEGKTVVSFEVVIADGTLVRCSRTEHPDLFHAVINGFGWFGLVVRATYRLLDVGGLPRVRTRVTRHPTLDTLPADLLPDSPDASHPRTRYALLTMGPDGLRNLHSEAEYVAGEPLAPMVPHQPYRPWRLPLEWLVHWCGWAGQAFWNFAYDHYVREDRPYVDSLEGYTFLMDGGVAARRAARRVGLAYRLVQGSFIVPRSAPGALVPFIQDSVDAVRSAGLRPALFDAVHLPADEPFVFSSTRGLAGDVVTFTFEHVTERTLPRIAAVFSARAAAARAIGGRVHLTKNVYADKTDLAAMYADALPMAARAKRSWDPEGRFASGFLDRVFPELVA